MPPATRRSARARDRAGGRASPATRGRPPVSTARDGSRGWPPSLVPFLPRKLLQRLLRLFDVVERETAGFDQMRHHGLNFATEKAEQLVDETALRRLAGDCRFEDMGVADLLHAAYGALRLEAIHHRLHRGVGGTTFRRQRFLD